MVQSSARTVDEYVRELPAERRAAIARLREVARRALPGFTEEMRYGMPYYARADGAGLAFASQVRYLAIYPGEEALTAHRNRLARYRVGKACVRFPNVDGIDWELIESIFRGVARGTR